MYNWWSATNIIYIIFLGRGENMSLGQRLTELRKSKKMSQEEVAEELNVTRQTISKWETDQSTPDFDKIVPLCKLFEISSDELLTGKKKAVEKIDFNLKENKQKRTMGLVISILLYFISVIWIMISIPVLKMNPIVGSAIFILICGISTCILIYSRMMYKKEKKEEQVKNKLYKQIEDILGIITVIIYLGISFITLAWHITWMIWLIYALVLEIIKLVISLRGEENEK